MASLNADDATPAIICESAGTGRQARLRGVCRPTWEFKSPLSHQQKSLFCLRAKEAFLFLSAWRCIVFDRAAHRKEPGTEKQPVIECVPEQETTRHLALKFGFEYEGSKDGVDVFRLKK